MKCISPYVALFLVLFLDGSETAEVFRFSNTYGDHMVLQQAPQRPVIWGFGQVGQRVRLRLDRVYHTKVKRGPDGTGIWSVRLRPQKHGGPFTIVAKSRVKGNKKIKELKDVMFGDVWLCGGEHNMEMPVRWTTYAESTIKNSTYYSNIRLFTAGNSSSKTPRTELENIRQNWTRASPANVGGKNDIFLSTKNQDYYFSALCWNYGVQLYDQLRYPIGLISSNWNGSIEAWSSADALQMCNVANGVQDCEQPPRFRRSYLWNGMIHPFLRMTIYGAIWYQGETNAVLNSNPYKCMFPAMIDDWRAKWHEGTRGNTDKVFPFGFVQLSSVGRDISSQERNFAQLRWNQTAGYGYVPNPRQKKVFMAVAMDLGNPFSPFQSSYPADKRDVGIRLARAGLAVAYGKHVYYSGPLVRKVKQRGKSKVKIYYRSVHHKIEVRRHEKFPTAGFEVLCRGTTIWMPASIKRYTRKTVVIKPSVDCRVKGVRYSWSDYPCFFKECPIYSGSLPSPPFIKMLVKRSTKF